jgi:hypothetical protein
MLKLCLLHRNVNFDNLPGFDSKFDYFGRSTYPFEASAGRVNPP